MPGVRFDNHTWTASGNAPPGAQAPLLSVPRATISIVTLNSSVAPPYVYIQLFQDAALTIPLANPLQTDDLGNFGFWASSGTYAYVVQDESEEILAVQPFSMAPTMASASSLGITLIDTVTGLPVLVTVVDGVLTVQGGSAPAHAINVSDSSGGATFAIVISNGTATTEPASGSTPGPNPVLIDTVTGVLYTLVVTGATLTSVPGGTSGVPSILLVDTVLGTNFTLTMVNGTLTSTPA